MKKNEFESNPLPLGDVNFMSALISSTLNRDEYLEYRRLLMDLMYEDDHYALTGSDLLSFMTVAATTASSPERAAEVSEWVTETLRQAGL